MGAAKVILAINAGSSSVKASVYSSEQDKDPKHIADAQVSGLTADETEFKYTRSGDNVKDGTAKDVNDHDAAFDLILKTLVEDDRLQDVKSTDDIAIVVHRVVHGGDYEHAQVIDDKTYHLIEGLSDLAPLHNASALSIMQSCMRQLRSATNVACFDSQFHTTIPPHISTYPIDQEIAKKNGLRKYGFHGISYAFIARASAEFLGKNVDDLNIIVLHLGSGASACAIKNGKSRDTSMGLTPLDGLPGATRSGGIDPSLIFHYTSNASKLSSSSTKELHISTAEEILNKKSGWKALTGSTDFGTIAGSDEPSHKLAFDLMVDRVSGFVGSYYVSLQGEVDALVFAGGIGEKSVQLREAVAEKVACLGFELDREGNTRDVEKVVESIGKKESRHAVLVCQTDEQYEMARTCSYKKNLWT